MKTFHVLTLIAVMALTILTAVNGIPAPNILFRRTLSSTELHMLTPAQLVAIRSGSESAEFITGPKVARSVSHFTPRSLFVPGLVRSASASIPAGVIGYGEVETVELEPRRAKNLWGLMKREAKAPTCSSSPFDPPCTGPTSSASTLADASLELFGFKGLGLLGTVSLVGVVMVVAI